MALARTSQKRVRAARVFSSWDIYGAFLISGLALGLLSDKLSVGFAQQLYQAAMTVLAILFSVYFAALALIVSSGTDDFIVFLEEADGLYTELLWSYRLTLRVVFVALLAASSLFVTSLSDAPSQVLGAHRWAAGSFTFLFSYALFAVFRSAHDSLEYAARRARFLVSKR